MRDTSPTHSLTPASYIVLGLLKLFGPGTSYDLKRWADDSVGFFWTFPRSQLYAEPQRLASLKLLDEHQERGGRRRREYSLTPAGQTALADWLNGPAGFPELRDLGLLKLFFSGPSEADAVNRLAAEQLELHQARLAQYEAYRGTWPTGHPIGSHPLGMGLLYERANIAFWSEVLKGSTPT